MKKCYCCGADVPDQSKFCPKCGKPMAVTQDLIDRARANDPDAQAELYERTYKTVYSRIRAKVPDSDTVMDIMQESYLHAFTGLNQLQKAETFPSWILTIANRQVCDWYKKNGKEQQNVQMSQLEYENDDTISNEDDLLEMPEYREDFSPDESLDRAETGRLLSEILDTLPEDQRIILTMRYYDEMSLQEISEDLGVNLSTVKSRLTAGKKKVEAKVLELEKSGTKLYSLGPIAFLVYLLHHAELFAPAISANTVIGLAAAGAAGAGGAATAHVTAGAAAKAAVVTAAKGVSVKVVAIVAAAVVVVGGGVTALVVTANNSHNQETAEESETPAVVETVEPSETPTPTPDPIPDPPSYEAVYNMTAPLGEWAANITLDTPDMANSSAGNISLNTNEAVELAGLAAASEGNYMTGDLSSDQMNTYLKRLFGSQFQLSDFANTPDESGSYEYSSAFSAEYPNYSSFLWLYQAEDGNFNYEAYAGDPSFPSVSCTVKSIDQNAEDGSCTATVEYDLDASSPSEGYYHTWSFDIYFDLVPDEEAEYGWAIVSFSFSDIYNEVNETVIQPPSEDTIHAMIDPYAHWFIWTSDSPGKVITPTLNQAAELAACAYYWENDGFGGNFDSDMDPVCWSYILPEAGISESLKNRFGPGYDLSAFTNTASTDGTGLSNSGLDSALSPDSNPLCMMLCNVNGQYKYTLLPTDGLNSIGDINITGIDKSEQDDSRYIATVEYWTYYYSGGTYDPNTGDLVGATKVEGSVKIEFELTYEESSAYGWVITQITYK